MSIDSPQKKPGTQFLSDNRSSDRGTAPSDPLAGKSNTSTHTDFISESVKERSDGKFLEGQNLRGYEYNEATAKVGEVKDATVAADGTRRVKDIG